MRNAALVLVLLCACESEKPPPFRLWTIDDILEAAEEGESYAGIAGPMVASAPGERIAWLSPPYAATEATNGTDLPGLAVLPSFSEGRPVAYFVSEIWQGYPEVWVQPMYILVTAFDEKAPFANQLQDAKPIFGIDVDSAFYSPYWEVFYVKVPADTPPDRYRSAQQLLDAGFPMKKGPGLFCALSHRRFGIALPAGAGPVRPLSGQPVDAEIDPESDWGWVDGRKVYTLTLGPDTFAWDEERYVREDALFVLARRGPDGEPAPIGVPTVGGTGPLGSHTPPDVRNGRARFGSLWRMILVLVPDRSGVVVPEGLPELKALVERSGLVAPPLAATVVEKNTDGRYTGRVAREPRCFDDTPEYPFPDSCQFLDGQEAVEKLPSQSFFPTDVLVACPFIEWPGTAP